MSWVDFDHAINHGPNHQRCPIRDDVCERCYSHWALWVHSKQYTRSQKRKTNNINTHPSTCSLTHPPTNTLLHIFTLSLYILSISQPSFYLLTVLTWLYYYDHIQYISWLSFYIYLYPNNHHITYYVFLNLSHQIIHLGFVILLSICFISRTCISINSKRSLSWM